MENQDETTAAQLAVYTANRAEDLRQIATWVALGAGFDKAEVDPEVADCEASFYERAETATDLIDVEEQYDYILDLWIRFVRRAYKNQSL